MEKFGEWEEKNLKDELLKGKELANQLQVHLNVRPPSAAAASSSDDGGEVLVQKILCSYEKALLMLNYGNSSVVQISESPSSLNGSPKSGDSDGEFRDQDQRNASRKRNNSPTWTKKFRVSPGVTLEGSLEDGFCWRKYGQKGILGAKHPRGYYRCTHRNLQGCLATKQVQRSDEDPTVFEITYRGNHTCSQVCNLSPASEARQPNCSIDKKQQNPSPDALLNSWSSLRVITENLDPPFSTTMTDMNFGEFSPSFMSPATSGLSCFSGNDEKLPENKSGVSGIFAPATSAVSSPAVGLEFPFGEVEMEPSFSFDSADFF